MLNLNEEYPVDQILKIKDLDNTKYKFKYTTDIGWEDEYLGKDAFKIWNYYENEDNDKFINLYNSYYADIFKVSKILVMKGAGKCPLVELETVELMTIKEFLQKLSTAKLPIDEQPSVNEFLHDYVGELTVTAIEGV